MLFNLLLRPLASGFHTRALQRPVPHSVDDATIRSDRPEAVRVLLLGSGVTTGWGVLTHGLGLAGALQRTLQERLQRPVDVEQVSEVGALLADGTRILGSRAQERWDVVVVAFGLSDAVRLTPVRAWAQALDRLLARFDADLPPGPLVPLLLVGIPPTESLQSTGLLGPCFARHADRLNGITEQATRGNRRAAWTPLSLMDNREARPQGSPEAYRAWSESIAAACLPLLAPDAAGGPLPIVDAEAERRDAPPPVAATTSSAAGGPDRRLSRRRRLSLEGRQLTRTAAVRSVPPERDVRIQGPDPVRVLLVGGEYAVGFGTRTRAEALDGALARLIHVRTGRGVVVENRSEHGVRLEQLAGSLGPAGAHTFDVVLWTPTFDEGARALLRSRWVAGLVLLLRRIETTSDAAVVLLGFPALVGGQPLAVVGRARAAQINRLLRRIAARARVGAFVEPPSIVLGDVETVDGAAVYQEVAIRLLPTVLRLLDAADDPHVFDAAVAAPVLVPA